MTTIELVGSLVMLHIQEEYHRLIKLNHLLWSMVARFEMVDLRESAQVIPIS